MIGTAINMMRLLLLTWVGLCGCVVVEAEPAKPPNILFAISDDQSWLHAGAYGTATVKTPAFDRIAREGVLFEHAFCAAPSCAPSRA